MRTVDLRTLKQRVQHALEHEDDEAAQVFDARSVKFLLDLIEHQKKEISTQIDYEARCSQLESVVGMMKRRAEAAERKLGCASDNA